MKTGQDEGREKKKGINFLVTERENWDSGILRLHDEPRHFSTGIIFGKDSCVTLSCATATMTPLINLIYMSSLTEIISSAVVIALQSQLKDYVLTGAGAKHNGEALQCFCQWRVAGDIFCLLPAFKMLHLAVLYESRALERKEQPGWLGWFLNRQLNWLEQKCVFIILHLPIPQNNSPTNLLINPVICRL